LRRFHGAEVGDGWWTDRRIRPGTDTDGFKTVNYSWPHRVVAGANPSYRWDFSGTGIVGACSSDRRLKKDITPRKSLPAKSCSARRQVLQSTSSRFSVAPQEDRHACFPHSSIRSVTRPPRCVTCPESAGPYRECAVGCGAIPTSEKGPYVGYDRPLIFPIVEKLS